MIPPPIPIKPAMKAPTNPRQISNPALKEWTVPMAITTAQAAIRGRTGLPHRFMADWNDPWFVRAGVGRAWAGLSSMILKSSFD